MKVFLINLDKDSDRLAAADAQLRRLGVAYERIPATYARELPQDEKRLAVNRFRWWCAVGRSARDGEIGCAMSHYGIYRSFVKAGHQEREKCICVLEDDVLLSDGFPVMLDQVERWVSSNRPQVVLLSNHSDEKGDGICRSRGDMYTEGYVITPLAAEALLNANWPMQTPCDHWRRWARAGIIELYHAFPTVCRQDQSQYESGTAGPGIFRVDDLPLPFYILHKSKRLIGKVIDGVLPV